MLTGLFASAQTDYYGQQQQPRRRAPVRTDAINYMYSGAYRNEVGASTTYGEITSANSTTVIRASGAYKYMISRALQVGGILELAMVSGNGQSQSSTGIIGTFTYNFSGSWNVSNSVFLEGGLGMADQRLTNSAAPSKQGITYLANIGKHFPMLNKVRYTPKIGFRKSGDLDMAFIIVPLNITIAY